MLDPGDQLLRAALGFAGCSMPSYDHALHALRSWLDSWSGMGHIAVGLHHYVPQMNTDADVDLLGFILFCIMGTKLRLDVLRALHGVGPGDRRSTWRTGWP